MTTLSGSPDPALITMPDVEQRNLTKRMLGQAPGGERLLTVTARKAKSRDTTSTRTARSTALCLIPTAITEFDAPGSGTGAGQGTNPMTNNSRGMINGFYIDTNNVFHGFLRLPW